jgi:hypothetical protein
MNVVLIVLDGVGARWVDRDYMPTLHGWGVEGVMRPGGATSVLCSSTYPNFASIVTGALPSEHGMFANEVVLEGVVRHASEAGPRMPTFLDGNSEVVVGDHHLVGVMGAHTAGRHWPPSGGIPDGVGLDAFGYVSDEEVTARVVDAVERRPELLFVQLNGPDTAAHLYGPDSDEAIGAYGSLDRCLAIIDSALRPHWDDTLLLVTSDHDQETVDLSKTIDLGVLAMERAIEVTVLNEGSAAVLVGPESDDSTWFEDIPGVEQTNKLGADTRLVSSQPGWWFAGAASPPLPGAHGGLRTRSTVAVASGSKPAVSRLSPVLGRARFGAEDWHEVVQSARSESAGDGFG